MWKGGEGKMKQKTLVVRPRHEKRKFFFFFFPFYPEIMLKVRKVIEE